MVPQKPLQKAELDLLSVIVRLHAQRGAVNRDVLSVEARGQGLEFGRALSVLRGQALVEEVVKKPFFLARLLGARPVALIRPTAAGLAMMAGLDAPAVTETDAPPPVSLPEPVADATTAMSLPEASPVPTPVIEETMAAAVVAETTALPVADGASASAPVAVQTAEPVAPMTPPAPRPAPRKPLPPNAYTDELGGAPLEDVPLVPAFRVDPEIVDGLRDLLDVIGMPLTYAGEALIADRMAKGATAGDALMQVVLFAFAHAIRLDSMTRGTLDLPGLTQYAVEVVAELEKLHLAEAISADRFAEDSALIRALVGAAAPDRDLAQQVLTDPVGGAAPPALLPEDLRLPAEDIGEPSY